MKKIIALASLGLLIAAAPIGAQTVYDAAKITNKDLNGTARFVGMGGAMGALGGDISTIGTNPAGIGIYRRNDAMVSFGLSSYGTESNYMGNKASLDKTRGSFDNAGFVLSTKIGNATALRYVNFGFNYKRAKSFYKNMSMAGNLGDYTQTDYMAMQANDMYNNEYNSVDLLQLRIDEKNPYDDGRVGWLGALGFDSGLVLTDDDPDFPFYRLETLSFANYRAIERGGIDQYDFNIAFNIQDRVYLGFSISASDVDYRKSYFYSEDLGDGNDYNISSENRINGMGWNAKLGVIFRPLEYSPLRIGLAIHTPTLYNLTYKTSAVMQSNLWYVDNVTGEEFQENTNIDTYYELYDTDMNREFKLRTPWTYNVSLGYTVGNNLALGAEYEYQDYSSMKFRDPEGYSDTFGYENSTTPMMKGVSTLRLGAEYKVIPQFALRAGYNYSSAIFNGDAFKDLPYNSIQTDTDFANTKALSNYTLGIGYRGSIFYADLAYKFSSYKEDFYPFVNQYMDGNDWVTASPQATTVKNTRSQVLLTLGLHF